jgi:hypothetical protein
MKKLLLLLLVSSIAYSSVAAAQSNSTQAPAGSPDDLELVIDEDTAVVSFDHANGEAVIEVYSTAYKPVSFAPEVSDRSRTGTVQSQTRAVEADQTTTVRIATPGGVTIWTDKSVNNGQFHYIRPTGSSFVVSGPYSGSDVRDAGIGGALGVVIAVLYEAVSAKIGSSERGERVA